MGDAGPRPRPPSIRDVADAAGVSYQTVSRVLNAHPKIAPSTETRVREAIGRLGYRPNRAARTLVSARSRTLGVLLPARALYGPFNAFLAIEAAARQHGYAVSAAPFDPDVPESITAALESLAAHGVEGLVIVAQQEGVREAVLRVGSTTPVVTLQGDPNAPAGSRVDQGAGADEAMRHLLDLGHRRIAHVAGPKGWADADDRERWYRTAMTAAGFEPQVAPHGDWSPEAGHAAGLRVLQDDRVTAVFCANDEMAIGLLHAARELGRRVPEDLSVVGYDDIPAALFLSPPLTTVRQDFAGVARTAVDALIARFEPDLPVAPSPIASHLVVRSSTAPVTA